MKYPLTTMSNAQAQLTFQPWTLALSDDLAGLVINASAFTHGDKMGLTNVEVVPQSDIQGFGCERSK